MLPTAHIALSYLISQIPTLFGKRLSWREVFFIIFCGVLPDFDLIYIYLFKAQIYHHLLPTHTPAFAVGVVLGFYVLFRMGRVNRGNKGDWRNSGNTRTLIALGLVAILGHLVLDDTYYWLYLLGITESGKKEIFWLYPFSKAYNLALATYTPFRDPPLVFLAKYVEHPIFIIENALVLFASIVFLKNEISKRSKN